MFGLNKLRAQDRRTFRQETGGAWGAQTAPLTGLACGLISGTRIATAQGWRPVEAIIEGDLVLTFDRGLQPVRAVTRGTLWQAEDRCPMSLWPLRVPTGALGNKEEMILLPEQPVVIESDTADLLFGDPFAMVHAADLDGVRGIERIQPLDRVDVIQLHFDDDQVVFAGLGALVFCSGLSMAQITSLLDCGTQHPHAATPYAVLPPEDAQLLVECLRDEDQALPNSMPWAQPHHSAQTEYAA